MERRTFLAMLAGGFLASPLTAEAQSAGKVWRIGYMAIGPRSGSDPIFEAFPKRLRETRLRRGPEHGH